MASELRSVLSPLISSEEQDIWITANSYVRLGGNHAVDSLYQRQFILSLRDTDEHEHCLSIHASTLEEAIICLDYLVGLQDTHFEAIEIWYKDDEEVRLCPFGVNILETVLQNSARRVISFNNLIFTPDHCRTLATSGTKTNIEFYRCEFQDEGAAFVEASAGRQDETSGPTKLCFFARYLFNDRNWALFLSQHKLESLELRGLDLNSEVSCRAVATAQVRYLTVESCDLEDGGAALVESVRQGRGPKELCFRGNPFHSSESLSTFMNALRGNEHLERLHLISMTDQVTQAHIVQALAAQALAAVLHENKGLVHLTVYFPALEDSGLTELLKAVSLHPSLSSLDVKMLPSIHYDLQKHKEFTKAVADMLSVNKRVEVMNFDYDTFDKDDWDAYVAPRLECNLYRKWLPSIQKIAEASTRAAVLARALAKFAGKPHLVWMLLNQSLDIVSSFPDSALTRADHISIPSRKRSRSPSSDEISAH
jgi:hypothetical protein